MTRCARTRPNAKLCVGQALLPVVLSMGKSARPCDHPQNLDRDFASVSGRLAPIGARGNLNIVGHLYASHPLAQFGRNNRGPELLMRQVVDPTLQQSWYVGIGLQLVNRRQTSFKLLRCLVLITRPFSQSLLDGFS